jgi:uncharacterized protein (TIGR02646 family)
MKYIQKGNEPSSLAAWNRKLGNRMPNWKSFSHPVKNDVYAALLTEQGYSCCYCGISINRRNCHIEHYRPKSKYPDLTFDYKNLIASCQGEDEKRPTKPVHCGHKKGGWFEYEFMVSPLDANCVDFFKYSGYGEIIPTDNPDREEAAETTIARLALDIDKLKKMRRNAIDAAIEATDGLSDAEIELLFQGYQQVDSQGRYTPFLAAINYTFKQYLIV